MDPFNRKRIAALEARNEHLARELYEAGNRLGELVDQLKAVDQALWNFSQSISPDQARNAIRPAIDAMNERKNVESNRITRLLVSELHKEYGR